jgi:hypothetical protein
VDHLDAAGQDQRGADPLADAGEHQDGEAGSHHADERAGSEDHQADVERADTADGVTEPSTGEHQRRGGQQVGVDDPAELHRRQRQLVGHAARAHGDRGGGEADDRRGERDGDDGPTSVVWIDRHTCLIDCVHGRLRRRRYRRPRRRHRPLR